MQTVILPEGKSWDEIIVELEKRRDKEKYWLPTRMLVKFGRGLASLWPWRKPPKRWASPHKPVHERWLPPHQDD